MGRVRLDIDGCAGQHVSPTIANPGHFDWYRVDRPDRVRVIEHTCTRCVPTSYELCLVGGYYLIRRSNGRKTYDSPRVRRRVASQWWGALLNGRAV